MANESSGEAHAAAGVVDLASGDDSDTATDAEGVVGGDTDDEVPEGENYFGRAEKEGAAPAGANPFAEGSSAPEDDWAAQIAEAKAMVEAQRIAREKEEAAERAREKAAAELKGKTYEGRRKAGDPAPETVNADSNAGGGTGGASAHSRVRKMLKARRPLGGGTSGGPGGRKASETDNATSKAAPFSFTAPPPPVAPAAASPFAGFSLLASDGVDPPKKAGGGGVLSRLSGAPEPFEPSAVAAVAEEEEEAEADAGDAAISGGHRTGHASANVAIPAATPPTLAAVAAPAPSSAGNRTPLAVELDL